MNLEKLKTKIEAEIQRIEERPTTDWMTGKSVGLVTVLQWLDEPWEPDVALLVKVIQALEKEHRPASDELSGELDYYHEGNADGYEMSALLLADPAALLAEAKRLGLEE